MLGVASSSLRTWQLQLSLALTVVACVPLSDLDGAARGSSQASTGGTAGVADSTGGTVEATGGTGGTTGGTGGIDETGGIDATGGVAAGGATRGGEAGGGAPNGGRPGGSAGASRGGHGGEAGGGGHGGEAGGGDHGGEAGGGGAGGSLECVAPMRDCDDDPTDCETDISSDPAHCGACDTPCPGEFDECVASACIRPPCTWETATPMDEDSTKYPVPGNGCVKITQHLSGNYYLWADRATDYTYVNQCGDSGGGSLEAGIASDPLPACLTTIDLLGTPPTVNVQWWFGG